MESVKDIPENIRLALDFSRNFATAKPNIGRTEKEHIEGLANLLERVSAENLALQQRLTVQDQREDDLKGLLERCRRMLPINIQSLHVDIAAALNPTAEAESHE